MMDTLLSMRVLVAIVDNHSFIKAADQLGLSKAMVSKHLMHLENRLGARLLNRNSRNLSLTESGKIYLDRCRMVLVELDEVEATVNRSVVSPTGTIRLSAPIWLASDYFIGLLNDFRQQYPEVNFDIDISGRFVDIVEEGFDLALRASRALNPNLIARSLMPVKFHLVASPTYLTKHGHPTHPSELIRSDFLWYSAAKNNNLQLSGPEGDMNLQINPVLLSNNETVLLAGALAGMGITILPNALSMGEIELGTLIRLFPEYSPRDSNLYAVYTSRSYLSAKVRTFIDFLSTRMGPENI